MMTPPCPICSEYVNGGMTLVRHLCNNHGLTTEKANDVVDDLYAKINDKRRIGVPPAAPREFTVMYEHLTGDQCEALKERVRDKEKEFTWGTYGPDRDEDLQKYTIDKLSSQHLENILITQPQIPNELAAAILMLLKKRYGAL